jgi:metal-responsive CopG/Arc/MetJ family transcriptional regulator
VKRTTVKLPDDLDLNLRREAERRGQTVSELTREAIDAYLAADRPRKLAAPGHSGRRDISHRIEEILRSELAAR